MKYLLDTDICIFLLNGKDCVAQKIDEVGIEDCAISEVTKAELLVGEIVSKIKGRLRRSMPLELLFNRITIIPMSNSVKRYAENKDSNNFDICNTFIKILRMPAAVSAHSLRCCAIRSLGTADNRPRNDIRR